MNKTPKLLRLAAGTLAAILLAGCSQAGVYKLVETLGEQLPSTVVKNETISEDSKWINSTIDGSIDADTPTNVKDDYYTAVNKEWLLQPLPESGSTDDFEITEQKMSENIRQILHGSVEDVTGLDPNVMSAEELRHIQQLVYTVRDWSADTATRNALGVEPLRPYIEAIDNIRTLDDATDYFCNQNAQNPFDLQLCYASMEAPISEDADYRYTVAILSQTALSLGDNDIYSNTAGDGWATSLVNGMVVKSVLGRLGYTESEAESILAACYRFEEKLARAQPSTWTVQEADYIMTHNHVMDREELQKTAGNYPITTILDSVGLGGSDTFTVLEPVQLKELGKLYKASNLQEIKAYLMVNTVMQAVDLLDLDTTYATWENANSAAGEEDASDEEPEEGQDDPSDGLSEEDNALLQRYIVPYVYDAFQQIYIAHYCTAEQKAQITDMVEQIMTVYRTMLQDADWMSDETRAEALEKLEVMGRHILYPDNLVDYSTLQLDGCSNLLDVVAALNRFNALQMQQQVNQPVNRSSWDLTDLPTTNVNAMYNCSDNSINILAGLVADDGTYSVDKSEEENLARLGTILGHEITHGFDTNGSEFDKNGRHKNWWTDEDKLAFDERAQALIRYYSGLTPVSRGTYVDGNLVSGEAIADMGGVKATLLIAKTIPDFDYDKYFRSYAGMWRSHRTYVQELMKSSDSHPLAMLRVNVILEQFDEFQQTYQVQPGDGMYVAPENRILVW